MTCLKSVMKSVMKSVTKSLTHRFHMSGVLFKLYQPQTLALVLTVLLYKCNAAEALTYEGHESHYLRFKPLVDLVQ